MKMIQQMHTRARTIVAPLVTTAAVAAMLLTAASPAGALSWSGHEDSDWFNPANWGGLLPRDVEWASISSMFAEGPCIADLPVTFDRGGRLTCESPYLVSLDGLICGHYADAALRMGGDLSVGTLKLGLLEGSEGRIEEFRSSHGDPLHTDGLLDVWNLLLVGASGRGESTATAYGLLISARAAVIGLFFNAEGLVQSREGTPGEPSFLVERDLTVGVFGEGVLDLGPRSPWTGAARCETAVIGYGSGAVGTVSGGALTVEDVLVVGHSGAGTIENCDLTTAGAIVGGKDEIMPPGTGAVTLDDNDWTASGDVFIGEQGAGTVDASGGSTWQCADLYLGYEATGDGSASLAGGSTLNCRNLFLGGYGTGELAMTGASEAVVSGRAYLGYHPGGEGGATLGAQCRLEANELFIGGDATETPADGLVPRTGRIEMTDDSAVVRARQRLRLGACGSMAAVGGRIEMAGASLENESTDPAAWDDLANIEMAFVGEPGAVMTFEAAATDDGDGVTDLSGRFALGALSIDGAARLVNEVDNQSGNEAVYVDRLTLASGATLELNGLNLYYNERVDNGATVTGPGQCMQLQAPPAGDINGDGAVNLADFVILKSNFGAPGGPADGDLNGDGSVDLSDFVILKNNFGAGD